MKITSTYTSLIGWGWLMAASVAAETSAPAFEMPTTSPRAVVRQRVAATEIEITYHRPAVRGRAILGSLVPFGQVWRTGANAATTISFSTPVEFGGKAVAAGTYELFTIPGEHDWVVILHENRSQWGSYAYDPAHDIARVAAIAKALPERVESLTISLDEVTTRTATLSIAWDKTRIAVPIGIDVEATVVPQLEAALRADGKRPYFQAAMFYFDNDLDLDRAAALMKLALEANPEHVGMLYRLGLILERKGDRAGAIAAAERSMTSAQAATAELKSEYIRLNTELLARLRKE